WSDLDADGIQDNGEPGVANVTVELYDGSDTLVSTTTTNASGIYRFTDLVPGDYYVVVTLPPGYQFSPQDAGGNNVDSDVDTSTGRTITTTLVPDEDDLTWDAGLVPLASIGDRVWLDSNNNGVQDGGESGFPGITVNLLD